MAQAIHRLSGRSGRVRPGGAGPPADSPRGGQGCRPWRSRVHPCFGSVGPQRSGYIGLDNQKAGAHCAPGLLSAYVGVMAKLALSLATIVLPVRKAVRSASAPACVNKAWGSRSRSRFAAMNGRDIARSVTEQMLSQYPASGDLCPAAASKALSRRCATAAVSRRSPGLPRSAKRQ